MHNQALLAPLRSFVRQLDLASLDLFVLICQTGSIGAAAEQGQLAISSVSKRIKELENAVHTPLLVRHARGVVPTPAGECLRTEPDGTPIYKDGAHLRSSFVRRAATFLDPALLNGK